VLHAVLLINDVVFLETENALLLFSRYQNLSLERVAGQW